MGLHALVLYTNADVGLVLVLFTGNVLNVSTWFLLVNIHFPKDTYLQLASILH